MSNIKWIPNRFFGAVFATIEEALTPAINKATTVPPLPSSIVKNGSNTPPKTVGDNTVKIGTVNIKNFPDITPEKFVATVQKVRDRFDVAGFQEIDDEDRGLLARNLGKNTQVILQQCHTPIAYNLDTVTFVDRGTIRVHNVKPGTASYRDITWMIGATKRDNLRFMVINNHMIVKNPRSSLPNPQWRMQQWDRHHTLLRNLLLARPNMLVFVVGDMNSATLELPDVKWVVGTGRIDKIGVRQGKDIKANMTGQQTVKLPTVDAHEAKFATFDIRKR